MLQSLQAKRTWPQSRGMNQSTVISFFQFFEVQGLEELGTEKVLMVLHSQNKESVDDILAFSLSTTSFASGYEIGTSYIQKASDSKIVKWSLDRTLSQRKTFDVQTFFQWLMFAEGLMLKKLPFVDRYKDSVRIAFAVQDVLTAWDSGIEQACWGSCRTR